MRSEPAAAQAACPGRSLRRCGSHREPTAGAYRDRTSTGHHDQQSTSFPPAGCIMIAALRLSAASGLVGTPRGGPGQAECVSLPVAGVRGPSGRSASNFRVKFGVWGLCRQDLPQWHHPSELLHAPLQQTAVLAPAVGCSRAFVSARAPGAVGSSSTFTNPRLSQTLGQHRGAVCCVCNYEPSGASAQR
eukprot:3261070-Rhodomonas_salina.1